MLRNGSTMSPASLYSRLPSATRRAEAGCRLALNQASRPLPMLAPITRPSATGRLIRPAPASVEVSSTAARLEYDSTANSAPTSTASRVSPASEENSTCMPRASVIGSAACTINCRARMIRPRPISTRPIWPTRVCLRERNRQTPSSVSSGDSQERSRVSTRAISAVPTSAPSMIASAVGSAIRPWATKEMASSAVALLLCTSAVTPMPAPKASGALPMLWPSARRRCEPYTRMIPVRTICVPQTSRAMDDSRCNRVSIGRAPAPASSNDESLRHKDADLHRGYSIDPGLPAPFTETSQSLAGPPSQGRV